MSLNRYYRYSNRKDEPRDRYKDAGFSGKQDFLNFSKSCEVNFLEAIDSHPNKAFTKACFNLLVLNHTYNAVTPDAGPLYSLLDYNAVFYYVKFDETGCFQIKRLDINLAEESPKAQSFLQYSYANNYAVVLDNSMLKGDYDTFEDVYEALLFK
ncbi:hypothetical protein KIH41_03440 [Litoribacter ruber]|uniref:Uncharacterized protein n=1 Tax=Litoribacter ruber TaxID=702568 RepID=A0AAP2CIW4_9BACT|nr:MULTISPECIES: hypothetical protein [Litoribacter]MBS9524504.1 hypothetical protein [Litoribacter alkaliphilus]MBT0810326.1 hypothetical protein [Litoribacter ruber]